jgi:endogenous inhibitor of DNA gyrase (YacG/DUF329 family)
MAVAKKEFQVTGQRCPICREPVEHEFRPFCSRRCSNVDLSRWLTGAYAIPGGAVDDDEDGDGAAAGVILRDTDED